MRRGPTEQGLTVMSDELRDQLPEDLNMVDYVGAYRFPDNSRRRIPGGIYCVVAVVLFATWLVTRDTTVLLNDGLLIGAGVLGVVGVFSLSSGWRMTINEKEALVLATASVGFVVGHASAQQVWRGFRSRPTWRIFCYDAQEPPVQRGLVLIDAIDGRVIESLSQDNPEVPLGS